jgi:hypothetical protein
MFLWLTECIVTFSLFLTAFFIFSVIYKQVAVSVQSVNHFLAFIFVIFLSWLQITADESEQILRVSLFIENYWLNYYELINNFCDNDFFVLFLNFYRLNFVEFLILGFLLLLGSVITIFMFRLLLAFEQKNYPTFLNFVRNNPYFIFLRKQNFFLQGLQGAVTKKFGKK